MKFIQLTFLLLFGTVLVLAQDMQIVEAHLSKNAYAFDTSATAIILNEREEINLTKDKNGSTQHTHIQRYIKILNDSGIRYALITDFLLQSKLRTELISGFNCRTYNLKDKKIVETPLKIDAVKYESAANGYAEINFQMPDVTKGSVLYIDYEIIGSVRNVLADWELQGTLPKLQTELRIRCPLDYAVVAEQAGSRYKITQNNEGTIEGNYQVKNWRAKNITALRQEPFGNLISNLSGHMVVRISNKHSFSEPDSLWNTIAVALWKNEHFGGLVTEKNDDLTRITDSVTKTATTQTEKARSIFSYVRDRYENNNNPGIGSRHDLEQLLRYQSASEAEINLLLAAMLRAAGIAAQPVLVAKTGSPQPLWFRPRIAYFNYTFCKATIDSTSIFLDASNRFNSFGYLPVYCYAGSAFVIHATGGKFVELTNNNISDRAIQSVKFTSVTDTELIVKVEEIKSRMESNYLRNVFTKDTSTFSRYCKRGSQGLQIMEILYATADNLFDPEKPLKITYVLRVKPRLEGSNIIIPAYVLKMFPTNPFQQGTRTTDIRFPTKFETIYSLTINLKQGYNAEFEQSSTQLSAPDGALKYQSAIEWDKEKREIKLTMKNAIYNPSIDASHFNEVYKYFDAMLKDQTSVIKIAVGN